MAKVDDPSDSAESSGRVEQKNDCVGTETESQQHQTHGPEVTIHVPEAVLKEYHANQQEQRRREDRRYRLEIIALVVAAVYAGVTILLWRTTKTAADAAKVSADAVRLSTRADLTLIPVPGAQQEPNFLDFETFNRGNFPATDVTLDTEVHIWTGKTFIIAPHEIPTSFGSSDFPRGKGMPVRLSIPNEWVSHVQEGKTAITVVWAFDLFDGFEKRTANSCMEYLLSKDPEGPWITCNDVIRDTSRGKAEDSRGGTVFIRKMARFPNPTPDHDIK